MRSAAAAIEAPIRHVELERAGVSGDGLGRLFPAREVARADEDGEVLCGELLCDLEADSLIGSRDQGDALVVHVDLRMREV